MIVDLFLVHQLLKRLIMPFKDWKAFKLGIIDEDGNILIHAKDFNRIEQRDAFGKFDLMILNLKKLIMKLPGGKSSIATKAAIFYLLKEDVGEVDEALFEHYIIEMEGGAPSTNTSAIPASEPKKSKVVKRLKDVLPN